MRISVARYAICKLLFLRQHYSYNNNTANHLEGIKSNKGQIMFPIFHDFISSRHGLSNSSTSFCPGLAFRLADSISNFKACWCKLLRPPNVPCLLRLAAEEVSLDQPSKPLRLSDCTLSLLTSRWCLRIGLFDRDDLVDLGVGAKLADLDLSSSLPGARCWLRWTWSRCEPQPSPPANISLIQSSARSSYKVISRGFRRTLKRVDIPLVVLPMMQLVFVDTCLVARRFHGSCWTVKVCCCPLRQLLRPPETLYQ
jgi:hypothetical protein